MFKNHSRVFLKAISIILVLSLCITGTALADYDDDIGELEASSEAIAGEREYVSGEMSTLQGEHTSTLEMKALLDAQADATRQEIKALNDSIAGYDALIAEKTAEVEKKEQEEDGCYALFLSRVRAMEENGTASYLAILFEAESFSDLLARIDFVTGIIRNDERICAELENSRAETAEAVAELQSAKDEQEAKRTELLKKQEELDAQLEAARNLISSQMEDIESYKAYIAELDARDAEIEAEIADRMAEYERQRAEEAERKAAEDAERLAREAEEESDSEDGEVQEKYEEEDENSSYGEATGSFIWPTPSCYIVTSPYGMRSFPLTGEWRMHYGVDIGASWGSEILASDGGYVVMAEEHWSYGNFVMISHDNGYATLYAHMSSMNVSAGDYVSQGDVIGYIGETGEATGPHLHFEIRYDGERIDPLDFFSGYEIWD